MEPLMATAAEATDSSGWAAAPCTGRSRQVSGSRSTSAARSEHRSLRSARSARPPGSHHTSGHGSHTGRRRISAIPGNAEHSSAIVTGRLGPVSWSRYVVWAMVWGPAGVVAGSAGLWYSRWCSAHRSTEKSRHPEAVGRQVLIRNHRSRRVTQHAGQETARQSLGGELSQLGPSDCREIPSGSVWGLDVVVDAWLVGPLSRPRLEREALSA
jgi:hypothetical protein